MNDRACRRCGAKGAALSADHTCFWCRIAETYERVKSLEAELAAYRSAFPGWAYCSATGNLVPSADNLINLVE